MGFRISDLGFRIWDLGFNMSFRISTSGRRYAAVESLDKHLNPRS